MRLLVSKWSRFFAIAILALAAYALAGCSALQTPQSVLNPFSVAAAETADLFYFVFWIALVIFILVEGLLVWFVLRYQRRTQDEQPEQYHGNTRLEVTWTVIPALILVVVFVLTLRTMATTGPTRAPEEGIPVNVVGHQWWWEFRYDAGEVKTASELHMPVNAVMNVALTSENVIHSFWVPALMGKTDVMPGTENVTWLLGNTPGRFDGQCAEFCGVEHAYMLFRVIVESQADYDAWLENQRQPAVEPIRGSLEARGKELFLTPTNLCIGCHAIGGTAAVGVTGPNLTHFASRGCFAGCKFENTKANLDNWLRDPQAMKPGNLMKIPALSEEDIQALSAYLRILK